LAQASAPKPGSGGRVGLIVAVVVIIVVVIAVILYLPANRTTTPPTTSQTTGQAAVVVLPLGVYNKSLGLNYSPKTLTVVIGVNTSVTSQNLDTSQKHTVTSITVPSGAQPFDSKDLNSTRTSFTYVFTIPGTYQYHCVYHDWMIGTVVVVAAK
jgi:plastocyanin